MEFWSIHSHSRFSRKDALPTPQAMVDRAVELGYPALALTDHGTMSGALQHYLACRSAGIEPLIGIEVYLAFDWREGTRPKTYHATIVAFTEQGYRNLVRLNNTAFRQFRWVPVLDMANLAEFAARGWLDGLLMTGGCWFGLVPRWVRENDPDGLLNIVSALSSWFDGRFYIEIHNHEVEHPDGMTDRTFSEVMHEMACSMHLPTVLAQDNHYVHAHDQNLHDAFKMLSSWNTDNPEAATFPGDGYHMVNSAWMRAHHRKEVYRRGMRGLEQILSEANLRIPELETYQLRTPDMTVTGDAYSGLEAMVTDQLEEMIASGEVAASAVKRYRSRLNEELDVVKTTGFAGYLLLVRKVCQFMTSADIMFTVRGSATGSLINFLLGIGNLDPVHWGLDFDRFLAKDRVMPPDIDLDVEHERRGEVLDYIDAEFYAMHITLDSTYSYSEDESGKPGGSLFRDWQTRARNIGSDPDAPLSSTWRAKLRAIASVNGVESDGTGKDSPIASYGVHPAGMLIARSQAELDEVPVMYVASSKTLVTAYDQKDVEKLGMIKLDVLGSRTMTTLRVCRDMTGIRFDELKLTDRKVYADIAKDTTGLFQVEGGTSTKGVRRMKPSKISDLIAAMALFRPAARDSGATDSYLRRRSGDEPILKRHPLIAKHTDGTYGVLVYQEQAINILKDLGLSVAEVEKARKAIKASNANVGGAARSLDSLMERIRELADQQGMSAQDVAWLQDALHAYAGYSFNLAHATSYGVIAYATAWFRQHYPVAFWTGVLRANADLAPKYKDAPPPEVIYSNAARRAGLEILPPNVNVSGRSYSSDGKYIYKGLSSIKGIGPVAAAELEAKAPFTSLDDLARRVVHRFVTGAKDLGKGVAPENCPGVIRVLHEAGALVDLQREQKESDVPV